MAEAAGAVVYVRLSLVQPKAGNEARVAQIEGDLMGFFAAQSGYLGGYRITGGDAEGRIGRLTFWQSDDAADRVAQTDRVLALRSELMLLIEEETHVEVSWVAAAVQPQAPS